MDGRIKFFDSFFMYGRFGEHWKHSFCPDHASYMRAPGVDLNFGLFLNGISGIKTNFDKL